jgi:hypothetical protein
MEIKIPDLSQKTRQERGTLEGKAGPAPFETEVLLINYDCGFYKAECAPHPTPRFTIFPATQTVPSFLVSGQGCSAVQSVPYLSSDSGGKR